MPRKVRLPFALLVVLLCAGGGGLLAAHAFADTSSPSPSVSPSAEPTPSASATPAAVPAGTAVVAWAHKWRRAARRDRQRVSTLRRCLGRRSPRPLPSQPLRSADNDRWTAYGHSCKRLARRYTLERVRDRRIIVHPRGSCVARWRPLLAYVGWPNRVIPYALVIIRRESGGDPSAANPSGCRGLFQLAGFWTRHPFDPLTNVRTALAIWRREGWRPWVTAYDAP